jgi:hypothetical protein
MQRDDDGLQQQCDRPHAKQRLKYDDAQQQRRQCRRLRESSAPPP